MGIIKKQQLGSGTIDLPFLGSALATSPQMLQEFIVSKFGDQYPLTTLLQGIYPESQNEELIAGNQLKWQVYSQVQRPIYFRSVSGSTAVGGTYDIVVNDGWVRSGAVLKLEDGVTLIRLSTNGTPVAGAGEQAVRYTAETVGTVSGYQPAAYLFEPGRALNYVTAIYEEGSHEGHPMFYGTGDQYFQTMSLHRHKADMTGDALTTALIYETMREVKDGNGNKTGQKKMYRGWLPDFMANPTTSLLDFHQRACERYHIVGQANYDYSTGQIFNHNHTNAGKDVMMGDGFKQQLAGAYTKCYSVRDNISDIRRKFENMLTYLSAHWHSPDFLEMVAIGGRGAQLVMKDVMRDVRIAEGQQIWMTPDKEGKVVSGINSTEWITSFGRLKFMLSPQMGDSNERVTNLIYNGVSLPAESFDMYIMPISLLSNGKTNIRFFAKGKNTMGQQVNRSLVFGHIQGMTGVLANHLSKAAGDLLSGYANLVATGRDAEQFEVLSQKMLIITNPTEFARLLVKTD